ncbi:MAG TPA: protein kinase [Candidatus Binatia bacterium]|nr:protein kinase [Candidatus Binatia bacterium]
MEQHEQEMELAHILSVQIVQFASLPINEQNLALESLSAALNSASAVQTARSNRQLATLTTPDVITLAFFGSPETPLRCAQSLALASKHAPRLALRMGIHTGPVFRVKDLQGNETVAGGGISMTQRIAECGDGGHILLSAAIAEVLAEHTRWKTFLTPLGTVELKQGGRISLYNFKTEEAGNEAIPQGLRPAGATPPVVESGGRGSSAPAPAMANSNSMTAPLTSAAELSLGKLERASTGPLAEYELLGSLGAGGIGKVYKARHIISQRIEALKVLQQAQLGTPDMVERFVREIRVLASLNHPNIAALHTAFRHEDQMVMVMEFVEGETLGERLAAGPLPMDEGLDYIRQVLEALVYAHERGVIHRDIKPSNVMIVRKPATTAKLLDFGLAVSGRDPTVTASGTVLGSLYYMSPEQVRGQRVDTRSDLYSLGVSLYEMLSGRRPFEGPTQYEILEGHLRLQPPPPSELNPNVPPQLAAVVMKAMVKDPAQRYQSAREFLGTLQAYLADHSTPGPAAPVEERTRAMPATGSAPPRGATASAGRSRAQISPAVVAAMAKEVAEYIGPIAHIIVERTAAHCQNLEELYSAVALEIESEKDRAKFLAGRKRTL